jgi:hypothetical protein
MKVTEHCLEIVRRHDVVRALPDEPAALWPAGHREPPAVIRGVGGDEVRLRPQERDARVDGRAVLEDLPATVRRSVVEDEQIEVPHRLVQDGWDGLFEVAFLVVAAHSNDDAR